MIQFVFLFFLLRQCKCAAGQHLLVFDNPIVGEIVVQGMTC